MSEPSYPSRPAFPLFPKGGDDEGPGGGVFRWGQPKEGGGSMKYKTIVETSPESLDAKVNQHLSAGWELHGSPYCVPGEARVCNSQHAQALILKEPE